MAQWVSVRIDGEYSSFIGYAHKQCAEEYRVRGENAKLKRTFFGDLRGLECAECLKLAKDEIALFARRVAH